MIFSTQMMDTAFRYFGQSFHKILAVNFRTDEFQPIKVDNEEWEAINNKRIDFSDWLTCFCENECHPDDIWTIAKIMELGEGHDAETFYYRRMYEGKYHYTALSVVPGYDDWNFIFVKVLEEEKEPEDDVAKVLHIFTPVIDSLECELCPAKNICDFTDRQTCKETVSKYVRNAIKED